MKKIWKCSSAILVIASLLFGLFPIQSFAATNTYVSGNFVYTISSGEATITGYTGTSTNVLIPAAIGGNPVTAIGSKAFASDSDMVAVSLPKKLRSIGPSAFTNCTSLTDVTFPASLTSIGDKAFAYCSAFDSVEIPSNVTSVGDGAFFMCTNTGNLSLAEGIKSIGAYSFYGCGKYTDLTVPSSLTKIPVGAFMGNSALEKVVLPSGIVSLSSYAFAQDPSLTDIELPSTVTQVGLAAFMQCTSLQKITVPDSVGSLGDEVFYGCTALTDVTLGKNVKSIGCETFCSCTALEFLAIPNSVTLIDDRAFMYDSSLSAITLPPNLTAIGSGAFFGASKLIKLEIPKTVSSIGSIAFYGCSDLHALYFDGKAPALATTSFQLLNATLYYPKNNSTWTTVVKNSYSGTITWKTWDPSNPNNEYFLIGRDTNQFLHKGFAYTFHDKTYIDKLISEADWVSKFQIYKSINNKSAGVCHGIALSMIYASSGLLKYSDITDQATSYWTLGTPYTNTKLSDLILYYHLTQMTDNGAYTESTDRYGFSKTASADRLTKFLTDFVAEAQKSESQRKPFVLSYMEQDGGHSVVVCGYKWNAQTSCHEIKIYDENSYLGTGKPAYLTMTVPESCASFSFSDANAVYGGYTIQDTWTSLRYYGLDTIYQSVPKVHTASDTELNTSAAQTVDITISANKKFKLTNAEGAFLSYDGTDYTSDMNVYSCSLEGTDSNQFWRIKVDASSAYVLTNFDSGCEISATIDGKGYAASAENADRITLNAQGIEAEGSAFHLDASVQTSLSKSDLISISADSVGDASLADSADGLTLHSDTACSDVNIISWKGDTAKRISAPDSASRITVSDGSTAADPVKVNADRLIQISKDSASLLTGKTLVLSASTDLDAAAGYTWSSSDSSIASVSADGTVTAHAKGSAKVTVSLNNGTIFAVCNVTVMSRNIADYKATLSKTLYKYDGKAKTPTALLDGGKLKNGSAFIISYKNNKNIGTATATLTGTGEYYGTITKTYRINVSKGTVYKSGKLQVKITDASTDGTGSICVTGISSKSIKAVSIPSTVKIGGVAFRVTSIGTSAFENCKKLKKATIGTSVATIQKKSFYGDKALSKIVVKSKKVKIIGKNAFKGISKHAIVYCPAGKKTTYAKLLSSRTGYQKKSMHLKAIQ